MGEGCGDRPDVPGQIVCVFAGGGTLRPKEPEEGSLRALCAARTEAGEGREAGSQGCCSPPGPSRFAGVCVRQLDGITSFWKSALPTWTVFRAPFALLLLLPQL